MKEFDTASALAMSDEVYDEELEKILTEILSQAAFGEVTLLANAFPVELSDGSSHVLVVCCLGYACASGFRVRPWKSLALDGDADTLASKMKDFIPEVCIGDIIQGNM